jgi:hypothetical protein
VSFSFVIEQIPQQFTPPADIGDELIQTPGVFNGALLSSNPRVVHHLSLFAASPLPVAVRQISSLVGFNKV